MAGATTVEAEASPFTGASLGVTITIDDGADPGNLEITVAIDDGGDVGDLRGVFFHVADESLIGDLSVVGADVTDSAFAADDVINLGGGNVLQGGGSPCPCDIGVEFGTPGLGSDDIRTTTFTLMHASMALDVSLFADQLFGVRATSVGAEGGHREGSSKLVGLVPEPSTALFMMLGLAGLGLGGRSARPSAD